MQSTEKIIKVRKALAWKALHDMKKIWTSQLPKGLKLRFFHAAIEIILLYGCESLDSQQVDDQIHQWLLHQDATDGTECLLEGSHHEPGALWQHPPTEQEDQGAPVAPCWSLPTAPRATSQ